MKYQRKPPITPTLKRIYCSQMSCIDFPDVIFSPQRMKATKCPSDEISLSNKVAANNTDFPDDVEYVLCC